MYILIKIETNDKRINQKISKSKEKLEDYIQSKGFFWIEDVARYIDDKTIGIVGGSGVDYIIEEIEEI